MPTNPLKQLLDNSIQLTELSRKQLEEAVNSLVRAGAVNRSDSDATVQSLLERGRQVATQISDAVQAEVSRQLGWLANRVDDIEDQLESFVSRMSPGRGAATKATTRQAATTAKKTSATKSSTKKAPAKRKAAAKKTAAKKAPAKKSAAKKRAPVKKAGAKKAAASSSAG
jgi:polyhydroxyalkanoate synthesis regulator phasin